MPSTPRPQAAHTRSRVQRLWHIALLGCLLLSLWFVAGGGFVLGRALPKLERPHVAAIRGAGDHDGTSDEPPETLLTTSIEPLLAKMFPNTSASFRPPPPREYRDMVARTGCDIFTIPFDPRQDARCLAYLTNPGNWGGVTARPQTKDARTLKFVITFTEPLLQAMVKIPQKDFPREPAGEVLAYVFDRVLDLKRIPPTAWVEMPEAPLRDALHALDASGAKLVSHFADSLKGISNYVEWGERELAVARKRAQTSGSIPMSLQPMIADVGKLLSSDLRIPYKTHNTSWMRWLDPRNSFDDSIRPTVYYLSEIAVYDYVVGNRDRSPNKNSFVAGGDRHSSHGDDRGGVAAMPPHPGYPTYVVLDNGLIFNEPARNPISDETWGHMCLFPRWLVGRLRKLRAPGALAALVRARVPPQVLAQFHTGDLDRSEARLREVLAHVDQCLRDHPQSVVLT